MKRCISLILSLLLTFGISTRLFRLSTAASAAIPDGFSLCAESDGLALYFNKEDGNVAVLSKKSGEISYAFPIDVDEDSLAAGSTIDKLQSLIWLSYSDVSGVINEMDSCYDCVSAKQLTYKQIDNGLSLHFLLGNRQSRLPVPMVISVKEFNMVLRALEEDTEAVERLKYFYTYKNINKIEDENEKAELLDLYPGLKKSDMFICDELTETERLELAEYYKKAGYTLDIMDAEYQQFSYEETINPTPWFEFELRFVLDQESCTVSLPHDSIQYDSENFSLYKITLLPYFNSVKDRSGGYVFIPDQSGRQLVADGRSYSARSMSGKIYGRDYADQDDDTATIRFNLPIYVTKNGTTAVLTEILGGEASAVITAEAAGFSHSYFAAYPTFTYQNKVYFSGSGADSSFTMFEKNADHPDIVLKFTFVSENAGDLYTVADVYRKSLIAKSPKEQDDIPLFISTLGSIDTKLDILFWSFTVNNTLTSFEDDKTIIEKLHTAGITNIAMELQGIANGGMNNTAFSKFTVMNNLGGKKGLSELIAFAEQKNISVFPFVNLSFVKRLTMFDGYDAKGDGNRTIDGKAAVLRRIDLASGKESTKDTLLTMNSVSAKKYAEKMMETLSSLGLHGLSLGQLGNTVNSNFSKSSAVNRNTQVSDYQSILAQTKMTTMVSGANAYAIPYGDYFSEIPYSNTPVYNFGDKVLFLQAVLHGYVDYSIEKLNFSEDINTAALRCIETGASPDFTVLYRNAHKLRKDSYYSGYYSADFTFWQDKIVASYQQINGILKQVSDATITGYQTLSEGVTATRYSNNKTILVNYTEADYDYKGTLVKAHDAAIREERP